MAQFTIRIPDELNERVRTAAAEDHRSKNSEIRLLLGAGLTLRDQNREFSDFAAILEKWLLVKEAGQ